MKSLAAIALFLSLILPTFGQITGTLTGKTTAYFHDLYGKPVRTRELPEARFLTPEVQGAGPIKGPFSVRTYKSDKLTAEVYYLLPKLEAVYVKYSLPHAWTDEQLQAALASYGTGWRRDSSRIVDIFPYYKAASGERAFHMASQLSIMSQGVIDALRESAKAADAKRKEVPKF